MKGILKLYVLPIFNWILIISIILILLLLCFIILIDLLSTAIDAWKDFKPRNRERQPLLPTDTAIWRNQPRIAIRTLTHTINDITPPSTAPPAYRK